MSDSKQSERRDVENAMVVGFLITRLLCTVIWLVGVIRVFWFIPGESTLALTAASSSSALVLVIAAGIGLKYIFPPEAFTPPASWKSEESESADR